MLEHEPIRTTRTIEADGTLSNTYYVLEPADGEGCFDASRYRFESNSHFEDRGRWGFELIVG